MKRRLVVSLILSVLLFSIITSGSGCDAYAEGTPIIKQSIIDELPVLTNQADDTDSNDDILEQETEIEPEPDPEPEPEPYVMYFTEEDVIKVAKVLYRECRGIPSDTQKACVAWVVCNRVGSDEFPGDTIEEIVTARHQFAYYYNTPVTDELYELALDVLTRWNAEQNGAESVGRVIPADYTFFVGDGVHNYFRNAYRSPYSIWDYSLPSPYDS